MERDFNSQSPLFMLLLCNIMFAQICGQFAEFADSSCVLHVFIHFQRFQIYFIKIHFY